ncbi:MAG: ComF family protein [Thermodesulfobacteriota bacterium]
MNINFRQAPEPRWLAWLRPFLDLLLPPACLACQQPLPSSRPPLFCPECAATIRLVHSPLCSCCGTPFPKSAPGDHCCGDCLTKKRFVSRVRSVALYQEPLRQAIHACKYKGEGAGLASFRLLKEMNPHTAGDWPRADCIVPVPLHVRRLQERGFNQAMLLARALFPRDKRIDPRLLSRPVWTEPQTSFDGEARRKNLKNAFSAPRPELVRGRSILLVDDVYTTGTTINECARCLKKAGAREVLALTLARATGGG